jgi:hypothetical protein
MRRRTYYDPTISQNFLRSTLPAELIATMGPWLAQAEVIGIEHEHLKVSLLSQALRA